MIFGGFLLLLSCDRGGDPDGGNDPIDPVDTTMVTPPPPTLRDTLLGNYAGICMSADSWLNTSTGQFITERDTFTGELHIVEMDTTSADYYTVHAPELYFSWFYLPRAANHADTLYVHNHQSVHSEDLAIVPAERMVIRDQSSSSPSGWGGYKLHCTYIKVE